MLTEKMELSDKVKTEPKIKSFNETFPQCAFALAIASLYPNINNTKRRHIAFTMIVLINSAMLFWFFAYLYKCMLILDVYNLTRNITVGILISIFFFKYFYVNLKSDTFAELLNEITEDLVKGNDMEDDYQEIYKYYIKLGKIGQACWIAIPTLLSTQFPIYAGLSMIYDSLTKDEVRKTMPHDIELKYIEDKQYISPYFEIIFAYNCIQCISLAPNFAGFDGSFCIAISHLQMKLKLISHKLNRAFKDSKDNDELEEKVKDVIKDHQEALRFYSQLQNMYGGWLFVVFLLTSGIISLNLYQNYISQVVDPKYTIFALSGVIHMFTPCYFASDLTKAGEEFSIDVYSVPWEERADPVVTKLLIIMIAGAQQPLILTGKGMIYFNMQLFISVLQTSYSFFTLISS